MVLFDTTNFCWDGDRLAAEVDGDREPGLSDYPYKVFNIDPTGVCSETTAEGTNYYHKDIKGSILVNEKVSGSSQETFYSAFGSIIQGAADPLGYNGEYHDRESGLIYLRNRYYDPSICKFITEDPHWNPSNMVYGDKQKAVSYAYVDNNKVYYDKYGDIVKTEGYTTKTVNPSESANKGSTQEDTQYYNVQQMPEIEAISQSSNLYAYAMNSPVNFVDPSGESVIGAALATMPQWVPWVVTAVVTVGGYFAHNNQKGLEGKMSKKQKEMFQREIEDYKRGMGRGPGDHLPWEVLVELAEEIRKNYK